MELNTNKARFDLGEMVTLSIDLNPTELNDRTVSIRIVFKQLEHLIKEQIIGVSNNDFSVEVDWMPPAIDFTGYLVEVYLLENDKIIDHKNIAVDVSSSWKQYPRYGYLTDFSQKDPTEITEIVTKLNRLHLNGFLFYDWQYRHDQPLPDSIVEPDGFWPNIANERVYFSTVDTYIRELHARNMMASNYNLVYGAYEDFALSHPSLGLYKDSNQKNQDNHDLPETWASDLFLVNPQDTQWQQHYFQMETYVNTRLQFDVMHLDTLGHRGTLFDSSGKFVDMPVALAHFTEHLKHDLKQDIVFNFVNEYAKHQVASLGLVSFAYSELWPDQYPTYTSLRTVIQKDQQYGLASVLALYMNYPIKSGQFNTPGVLLTEAIVLASGGSRLSMGDLGMLSSEYFPNNKLQMNKELQTRMTEYADFMVAYENVLRGDLQEVNDTTEIVGIKSDQQLLPMSVWLYSRENNRYKTLHLVNLLNRSDLLWRDDRSLIQEPLKQKNLKLKIPYTSTIQGIYVASPDVNGGSLEELKYTYDNTMITLTVPQLDYWTMILIVK